MNVIGQNFGHAHVALVTSPKTQNASLHYYISTEDYENGIHFQYKMDMKSKLWKKYIFLS